MNTDESKTIQFFGLNPKSEIKMNNFSDWLFCNVKNLMNNGKWPLFNIIWHNMSLSNIVQLLKTFLFHIQNISDGLILSDSGTKCKNKCQIFSNNFFNQIIFPKLRTGDLNERAHLEKAIYNVMEHSEAPKSERSDFSALKICPITKLSRFHPF